VVSHSPIELPHVAEFGKAVAPDTETFVSVSAEVTVIDKDVKLLSLVLADYFMYFNGICGTILNFNT